MLTMSTKTLKVFITLAIFVLTLASALLPYKLRARAKCVSIGNVFAGGIFLAAGLCHLLADSAEQFEEYYHDHDHDDHDHDHDDPSKLTHGGGDEPFPWAYAMAGIGFISTLVVEQIAHALTHGGEKKSEDKHREPLLSNASTSEDYITDTSVNADADQPSSLVTPENSFHSHFSGDNQHDHSHDHGHSHDQGHHAHHDHHDDHGHSHVPINPENQSVVVTIALWLALSFHSVVEGISLGSSGEDGVRSIAVAILAHKGLESFSLGTSLINSNATTWRYITFCFLFACMTPIGIIIGAIISASTEGIVAAFICGFAAGTFTYVAVVEVLVPEFKKQQDVIWKCFAVAAGFAGMAILALWV